ncbi:enoyl-CoA hydratase/isomerase family protein [Ammoniphilus resinae]|uniref:Enoyl-CoA hydratase/carnithine racemase n=1 Tax=Ammoniphilus resinae TaxID=861532 RepID=A0ABS4GMV7_9BACL|nr:enoyl-CoA hydratase/isomerase family protein [Ammoniphilus resinae]MBP1931610.1 enoyl-CoA hydratase/carnithine racemase [Ammoniphilus resinae]
MFTLKKEKFYSHLHFRQKKGNPIDLPFVQDFFEQLNSIDEETRILVIEGAPHFSVGMNLHALRMMNVSEVETLFSIYEQLLSKIETAPFITIAKMTGYAMGAGAELALACDFRLMEQKAKLGFPGTDVGFAYNTKRIQNFVPRQTAKRLILTGAVLTASEALDHGIVDHVTSKNHLAEYLEEFTEFFQDKSPIAIQYAKAAFLDMDPARAMTLSIQSKHYKEGAAAFIEERKPNWRKI